MAKKSRGWIVFKRIFSSIIMLSIIVGTCWGVAYFVGQQKVKDPVIDKELMVPYLKLLKKRYYNEAYTRYTTEGYRKAISYEKYENKLKILWTKPITVKFDSKKVLDKRTTRLRYQFLNSAKEIIFTAVYDVFKTDDGKYLIAMTYQPGFKPGSLYQRPF